VWPVNGAPDLGSLRGTTLSKPIVGMTVTGTQHGYWLVASDGGVFSFGDAGWFGSTGAMHLNKPIVGIAPAATGKGYWLFAGAGGSAQPVQRMVAAPNGTGYWVVENDGSVVGFGSAGPAAASAGTDEKPVKLPAIGVVHQVLTLGDTALEWALAQTGKPYQW